MYLFESELDEVLEHTRELWEDLRGERIFITGGTGFVGKWLVETFSWANQRLNLGAGAMVVTRRPGQLKLPGVKYFEGDGVSFEFPAGSFSFVIHAATDRGPDSFRRDIRTTDRVLEFAGSHGTRKLLFTSSGAIYGTQPYSGAPSTTDLSSAYGQAKRVSEFRCAQAGAVIARLFAFVGPGLPLDAHYAVGNFIGNVLKSEPVRIKGDGTPYRSYMYASDLAVWLWTLLIRGEHGQAYNVGSPEAISIAQLAALVVAQMSPGNTVLTDRQPKPGVLPARYVPCIEKAENQLGLKVLTLLPEAIRRTHVWHLHLL
jgi:dTDP-glucose 4,6-dehydratase